MLKHFVKPFALSKFELIIGDSLEFTCAVFGWLLPDDNQMYKIYKRSIRKTGISKVLKHFESSKICNGVIDVESNALLVHSVPYEIDIDNIFSSPNQAKSYTQPSDCDMILDNKTKCSYCIKFTTNHEKQQRVKRAIINTPAKRYAPLSITLHNRVRLAPKEESLKPSELQKTIDKMQKETKISSVKHDDTLSRDMETIMSENFDKASPFMKIFWEEQKRNFSAKKMQGSTIQ